MPEASKFLEDKAKDGVMIMVKMVNTRSTMQEAIKETVTMTLLLVRSEVSCFTTVRILLIIMWTMIAYGR